MVKKRTRARELALQYLYQLDLIGDELLENTEAFIRAEESDRATADFALSLCLGTREHRDVIDSMISGVAQNWDIARMAVIDRNVLRLGTYELIHCADIPPKVSINEAIELGKRFSTQNSGGFINGILDKIKDRYAQEKAATLTAEDLESEPDSEVSAEQDSVPENPTQQSEGSTSNNP